MLARVPWTPPLKAPAKLKTRKLNRDRQRHLVDTTAAILRTGFPTHFAFEATCRHGIRSGLCLEGWKWTDADALAAEIVKRALNQIGAQRPTWQQGQPEYNQVGVLAVERDTCVRCKKPLDELTHYNGRKFKFCSKLCKSAHATAEWRKRQGEEVRARYAVWRKNSTARHNAKAIPRKCERCGTEFLPQPRHKNQAPHRFCSVRCVAGNAKDVFDHGVRRGRFDAVT